MKNSRIKAVLFDFDGTLTHPGALDFSRIKRAVGCPEETPVLEYIDEVADAAEQERIHRELEKFELTAAADSIANIGAEDLLRYLRSKGLKLGIITRNRLQSVIRALENFESFSEADFDIIISRDDPVSPKPSPEGIRLAARRLEIAPSEMLVVGDFAFDVEAGNRAGATTVFLDTGMMTAEDSDHTVSTLAELQDLIRLYLPLPAGKFPNDLLKRYLEAFDFADSSVIIHPGIGEDTAAVDVQEEEVLILKSDPITFVTDAIGHYAVMINANDLATAGAVPRWFLTTLLFPPGFTPAEIFSVLRDLETVCRRWSITLCGGHTEITDAVTRPVVSGTLAGTVARSKLVDKRDMRPEDRVLLTKGVAVEGTTIIAREFEDRLAGLGIPEEEIAWCRGLLDRIGVIDEARIAAENPGTSAMHDVTEGGLATALAELSEAGGHRIRVRMESIPVFPQTAALCRLLDIQPLGLIGSGSLLICCRENHTKDLIRALFEAGIEVTVIGEVLEEGTGIEALQEGTEVAWPRFEVDELTRLFT